MSSYEEDFFDNGYEEDDLPSNSFYNSIIVFACIGFLGSVVAVGYAFYWLLFL